MRLALLLALAAAYCHAQSGPSSYYIIPFSASALAQLGVPATGPDKFEVFAAPESSVVTSFCVTLRYSSPNGQSSPKTCAPRTGQPYSLIEIPVSGQIGDYAIETVEIEPQQAVARHVDAAPRVITSR